MKNLYQIILLLFATLSAYAGVPENILALHKNGETMTTSFTETKSMPKLKKETIKAGTLLFESPETLRLDYTNPAGDYTLITATQFETFRDGKVQKLPFKNPQSRWYLFRNTLLKALSGDVEAVATMNESTAKYSDDGVNYVCTLTADKSAKHGIASLLLVYNKKTGRLVSLTVTECNGNFTTYAVK